MANDTAPSAPSVRLRSWRAAVYGCSVCGSMTVASAAVSAASETDMEAVAGEAREELGWGPHGARKAQAEGCRGQAGSLPSSLWQRRLQSRPGGADQQDSNFRPPRRYPW